MAKITRVGDLQRSIPSGRAPIASIRTGGAAPREDTRHAGAGFTEGANILAGIAESITDSEVAKANAKMSIGLTETIGSFDQKTDYGTFTNEYNGLTETQLGEIASTISNGEIRNQFVQAWRPKIAIGHEKIKAKAWNLQVQDERGQLIEITDGLLKTGIETGDVGETNALFNEAIDAATGNKYIDSDSAAKMKIDFKHKLATGRIERLPPEERVAALKQPWAKKNLPADDYATLLRKAEEETRTAKAQATVDDHMAKGDDRSVAMEKIAKIKDPELRAETEKRLDYMMDKQQKAELEAKSDLTDKWFDKIALGENTIADIKAAGEWDAMGARVQATMINAQSSSVSRTKVPFNISVEDQLNALLATKRFSDLRELYMSNAGTMSDEQNKRWSKVTIDGVVPVEVQGLFTATATLESKTPGYTKERRGNLKNILGEWYEDYQLKNNKLPTDKEVNDKTDQMVMEYDTSWYWGGTKPVFEMSTEEATEALGFMREEDPEIFEAVKEYFKGQQPDNSQFMDAYRLLREQKENAVE